MYVSNNISSGDLYIIFDTDFRLVRLIDILGLGKANSYSHNFMKYDGMIMYEEVTIHNAVNYSIGHTHNTISNNAIFYIPYINTVILHHLKYRDPELFDATLDLFNSNEYSNIIMACEMVKARIKNT